MYPPFCVSPPRIVTTPGVLRRLCVNCSLSLTKLVSAGNLINTGVTLRLVRAQLMATLAKHLRTSTAALRLLNPDIPDDSWVLNQFDRICVLPAMCGQDCGGAAGCDRPSDPWLVA